MQLIEADWLWSAIENLAYFLISYWIIVPKGYTVSIIQ